MPRSIKLKSHRPRSFNSRENFEYANVSLKNGFCRLCSAWCPAGHTSALLLWGQKSCAMHFKKPKFTRVKLLCHIQGLQLQPILTFVSRQTFSIRTVHKQYCDLSIKRKSFSLQSWPTAFSTWFLKASFFHVMPNFRWVFISFLLFFGASAASWTVPNICWQWFRLLAAQTLTVNGTSPFFYSFLPPWEMLLNASQPFLPGGGGGG